MVVFADAARKGQSVLLVLDIAPDNVAHWTQWVCMKAVEGAWSFSYFDVLKMQVNYIHCLNQHALLHPVVPNKLNHNGIAHALIGPGLTITINYASNGDYFRQRSIVFQLFKYNVVV